MRGRGCHLSVLNVYYVGCKPLVCQTDKGKID